MLKPIQVLKSGGGWRPRTPWGSPGSLSIYYATSKLCTAKAILTVARGSLNSSSSITYDDVACNRQGPSNKEKKITHERGLLLPRHSARQTIETCQSTQSGCLRIFNTAPPWDCQCLWSHCACRPPTALPRRFSGNRSRSDRSQLGCNRIDPVCPTPNVSSANHTFCLSR
jgi:hypothetical protein